MRAFYLISMVIYAALLFLMLSKRGYSDDDAFVTITVPESVAIGNGEDADGDSGDDDD